MQKALLTALSKAVTAGTTGIKIVRVKRAEKFKKEKIVFTLHGKYVHSSVLYEMFGFDIYERFTHVLPITYDEDLFNKIHDTLVRESVDLLRELKDFI